MLDSYYQTKTNEESEEKMVRVSLGSKSVIKISISGIVFVIGDTQEKEDLRQGFDHPD